MTNASQILAWAPHRTEQLKHKAMAGTLNQLSSADWETLIAKTEYRRYTFNDLILAQGTMGEALVIISDGEVRVECTDASGTWQLAEVRCSGKCPCWTGRRQPPTWWPTARWKF